MVVADLTATIIVALTLPLIPVFMVLVGKATEASNAKRWDALTRLSHHFLDVVEGMPTLRAFARTRAAIRAEVEALAPGFAAALGAEWQVAVVDCAS